MPAGQMFDTLYVMCVEDYEDALTPRRQVRSFVDGMLEKLGTELSTPAAPDPKETWGTTPDAVAAQEAFMNLG